MGGGNQGGGFLSQGGGTQGDGMLSPGQGRPSREKQSIMPLTIKQVLESQHDNPDDKPKVDGVEIVHVRLVGCIIDINEHSTNAVFKIEDGTGRIDAKVFIEQDESQLQTERRSRCREGVYVAVVGQIKRWQDKLHVHAFDIRPLEDTNQITQHFLEAIYAHLHNTLGPLRKAPGGAAGGIGGAAGAQPMAVANYGSPGFARQGGAAQQGNYGAFNGGGGEMDSNNLAPLHQKLLDIFQADTNPHGLSLDYCADVLKPQGIGYDDIRDAVVYLSSEGHIYTTVDDFHYKSTT
ncbi:hypothetical protein JKP88DRAFT_216415 [Tribonema minus]|uniref:Replication protein A 32 kDa subunit n=1 Tax=Tribonema minus TaxID=303371 RepID=A0A835YU42_9STRA|nr:hypothetical protein JKP88DRAFT_216415 [Tribonema minus]